MAASGAQNIPDLNWDANLRMDDFKFWSSGNETELLNRIKAVFGAFSLASPRSGIVDVINPESVVSSDTSRPLVVYISTNNVLQINVTPGLAINPNGTFVFINSLIQDQALASSVEGAVNVVYLENSVIAQGNNTVTRFNTVEPPRRIQNPTSLGVVVLSDYQNSVLFTPDRKANITVLAVVKVVNTITGLELQIDYTGSVYSFNRPWFSPVDVEHRSYVGSGLVTIKNPHGQEVSDFSAGKLAFFDQYLAIGIIQSKDEDLKGIPGYLCTETVSASRILTDSTGSVTSKSRFGGAGASYVMLAAYPVAVIGFRKSAHLGEALAFDWIPGTRILVVPSAEVFSEDCIITYTRVTALEPPTSIVSNNIVFSQPNTDREVIYSGGISVQTLVNPAIEFDGSGPVPREYTIFALPDGTVLRTPTVIAGPVLVDSIGSALYPVSTTLYGPAQLSIGLADANSVSGMSIPIRIFGKDENGTSITEDLTFSGAIWTPVTLPGVETPTQSLRTTNVFSTVTDLQILPGRVNDGPSSKITLFAEYEAQTTVAINTLARVAFITWDGHAATNLRDARQPKPQVSIPFNRFRAAAEIQGMGGTAINYICSEDLLRPDRMEITKGFEAAAAAGYAIFISDYTLINSGDQITLRPGKVVTAIVSGSPNRALGQFLASTSNQATRDDLIATVNYTPFASDFTAVANGGDITRADFTRNTVGSQGNEALSASLSNPTSITLSSSVALGGIDAFGEILLPRHDNFLGTKLPNVLTYDVTNIRYRYRSMALPIKTRKRITVIVHGIPTPQSNIQLRARVAQGSNIWKPWEVITGNGAFFTFTKASDITKVQLELFGSFQGYSVYEGDL